MNLNFKNITLIIIFSIIISFAYNHFNPNGIQLIRTEKKLVWENDSLSINDNYIANNSDSVPKSDNDSLNNPIINIDSDENFSEPKAIKIDFAYKLFHKGIKFIDARPVEEFNEGHIRGALNIPFYESDKYEHILSGISKNEIIVTYCGGHDCELSIMLGDELFKKGYRKIYIFYGGWNDWLKNNYPIEKTE